ncbi:SUMF1/EgtB/PvdO family nonheme iron enzyme [Candidatus Parabeggiatoa sp. HSG14]|uniref:formylglycine-generating enzyme family protein n=1 Tax=Candidatus Parabeggiatoa sp. HSG14 TaxID=3055593 RepID=UPI0025A7BBA4|nr:SUMF1/EgtB/PvdO family nonheme iron enzyme [Thiotrichales bacterium HSG14]
MTTLKLFILAFIFVATSGALFSKFFKEHKFLTFLVSVIAIIGSFYLIRDIYLDMKNDVIAELKSESTQNQPIRNESIGNELIQNKPIPVERETFPAGKVFRDSLQIGGYAPEMVVIPAGNFQMGDIQGDSGRDNEKPVHWVNIEKFAMGKYEVTFAEYDKFANATGREKPDDENWGRGNRPVINVSWHDAVAYTEWLTQQTGEDYRLPSESEWEYAARAGTKKSRYWGNNPNDACRYANVHDNTSKKENGLSLEHHKCTDGYAKTAPIGKFRANDFGLYDIIGNVWEWVADNLHSNYTNAPNDGRIWAEGADKNSRVLRGGSWYSNPYYSRAAFRNRSDPDIRDVNVGFRLVRVARTN